jgi:hypothetical protein
MAVWYNLCSFGTFFRFGMPGSMYVDKSGNPVRKQELEQVAARLKSFGSPQVF